MRAMKKILVAALIAMTAMVNAQSHMTFKGVEINGKVADVVKQLEGKGFTQMAEVDGVTMLMGSFTGQNVAVGIYATPVSKTVCRIAVVYLEGAGSWTVLSNLYEGLKERLTSKYGEPEDVTEEFESPYSLSSNPLSAFRAEKATYRTRYKTDNGGVTLSIVYYQMQTAVCLLYWDKENEAKMEAELEDEL